MKATNLQLFTVQLFECNNATIRIRPTFPESTKYQMTRYDVTDSNFLWIAKCCIMRTFRRRHRRKYERRRGASLPASSVLKNYNTVLRNNC